MDLWVKMDSGGRKWSKVVRTDRKGERPMFMGEFNHSLDEKGRIVIPSKFRDELGSSFVITQGLDGCLYIYPEERWQKFAESLGSLPGNKEGRQLQRYFLSNAVACEPDKQWRVILPLKLRENAGIEKELVFVGVLDKIEIWSGKKWAESSSFDSMDDVAEHMAGFGLSF